MRLLALLLFFLGACSLAAQSETGRPRILGIAHVALYADDLGKARAFYEDFLGFEEAFAEKHQDGADWIVFVKINDQQYLELSTDRHDRGELSHFAFYTDNAAGLRDYLARRGIAELGPLHKGNIGNDFFSIRDPDGHLIEMVQYQPDSWTGQDTGAHLPTRRISNRIAQIGIRVGAVNPTLRFYREVLGFVESSHGAAVGTGPGWMGLRVPDGSDVVEFLLYRDLPPASQPTVRDQICFARPDVRQAISDLQIRKALNASLYAGSIPFPTNQMELSLTDPHGTLVRIAQSATLRSESLRSSSAPPR